MGKYPWRILFVFSFVAAFLCGCRSADVSPAGALPGGTPQNVHPRSGVAFSFGFRNGLAHPMRMRPNGSVCMVTTPQEELLSPNTSSRQYNVTVDNGPGKCLWNNAVFWLKFTDLKTGAMMDVEYLQPGWSDDRWDVRISKVVPPDTLTFCFRRGSGRSFYTKIVPKPP